MNIHVLSHRDSDGRFAAYAAQLYLRNQVRISSVKFIEVQYNEPFPLDIESLTKDDHIYILDFAYDRETMDAVYAKVGKLQVLDHHETAQEALRDAPYAKFDMSKSGALLAWEYFFPNEEVPLICLFVHDYDLHEWKYTNHTAAFEAWLRYDKVGLDWEKWDKLRTNKQYLDEALMKGSVVVDINEATIKSFINTPNNVVFNSFYSDEDVRKINYAVFNGMHFLRNEISTVLYENNDIDMAIGWSVRGKEVIFSVRAPNPEKFSAKRYAEAHGGGGHPAAAAFGLPLDKGLELVKHLMAKT